jgi:PAS domain S-box-containing protein
VAFLQENRESGATDLIKTAARYFRIVFVSLLVMGGVGLLLFGMGGFPDLTPSDSGFDRDGKELAARLARIHETDYRTMDYLIRRYHPTPAIVEASIVDKSFTVVVSNRDSMLGSTIKDSNLIELFYGAMGKNPVELSSGTARFFPVRRNNELNQVLIFSRPDPWGPRDVSRYLTLSAATIILLLTGVGALIFSLASRRAKIREYSNAFGDLLEGEFARRMEEGMDEDFAVLAERFNQITARLEAQVRDYEKVNSELLILNREKDDYAREVSGFNERLKEEITIATGDLAAANTELDRRYRELVRLESYNEVILSSVASGIVTTDLDGKVNFFNSAGLRIFGFTVENVIGSDIMDLFAFCPGMAEILSDVSGDDIRDGELEVKDLKGNAHILSLRRSLLKDHHSKTLGAVVVFRDVTETRRLELEAQRNRSLASLGQLAAGVAHEIRNPLGAISGFAELISRSFTPDDNRLKYASRILDEVRHLDRLVGDILDFARPSPPMLDQIEINDVIEEAIEIAASKYGNPQVEFSRWLKRGLPLVMADRNQLRQVFSNILINAADALDGAGKVSVRSRAGQTGRTVEIEISDNGPGMEKRVQENVFNPFFTTKEQGTGLGLAVAYKIIEAHEGRIDVESEPGQGALFRIILPRV